MRVTASIQARMGSQRLPGKVLHSVCGKPLLQWQIERVQRARLVDEIVVATTTEPADDAIADLCTRLGVGCFRGSERDVLGRIALLLVEHKVELHVGLAGDSCLTDPHLVDEVVGFWLGHRDYDLVSNALSTTYPAGQEVTVYPASVLIDANRRVAPHDPLREHVSIHITEHPERYRSHNLAAPTHYRFPEVYLEVDTAEDLALMGAVIRHFYEQGREHFSLAEILEFLASHPSLSEVNRHVERRWKVFRREAEL